MDITDHQQSYSDTSIQSIHLRSTNGPSEAAHNHIDDDRYDVVKLCAVGQLQLDLSDQLRARRITST